MFVLTISGNLTADAEVKILSSGKTVCNFTVAVNHGSGEHKKTTYVDCGVWGKRAESTLPQYLLKGTKVIVTGAPETRAYTPKDGGEPRGVLTIPLVDQLELCGGTRPQNPQGQNQNVPQQSAAEDDDIPF